ncbi:MAG: recombinase family protein [Nanoarchaeota archaeon]|nr:recombinase family protein [Nanoarchaeota archaeon]
MTLQTQKPLAAIYVRVSTEEQVRQGVSLAAQEEALQNYAKALGYDLFRIYKDEGRSAKDIKGRPEMVQLLKDAEVRKFQAIFIYKLDRFSRSLIDLIETIEKLKQWGIDFVSLQDKIETTSASGKLMFHVISAFAEFERNVTSERTKFSMDKQARDGKVVSRAPFGYKLENKKMIQAENFFQVQELFQEFLNNEISLTKLAKKYGFSVNGVKKVLTNQTYLGKIKFDGQTHQGNHQPLISSTLFNHVQNKLEKRGIKK